MKLTKQEKELLRDGFTAFHLVRERLRKVNDLLRVSLIIMGRRKEADALSDYFHGSPKFRETIKKLVKEIN